MYRTGRLTAICLFTLTSSCGNGGSSGSATASNLTSTPPPSPESINTIVARLETEGRLPILDRSSDIAGPDLNRNGVRDDIDTYIANLAIQPGQRQAMTQYARSVQADILVNKNDRSAVDALNLSKANAIACIFDQFNLERAMSVASDIESMSANTPNRLRVHLEFSQANDGRALPTSEGAHCE